MKIAVVKPDHLGDFVLSSAAIRALEGAFHQVVLFVGTPVQNLAKTLFPNTEARAMDLAHLSKGRGSVVSTGDARRMLSGFDRVFFMRDDGVTRAIGQGLGMPATYAGGDHLTHETLIQQRALASFVTYSRAALFAGWRLSWPEYPKKIGLCVSAGFPTNRWPAHLWASLAQGLRARGHEVVVVGGPAEGNTLQLLAHVLGLSPKSVVVGGSNIAGFLQAISELDAVIATDGGTAHLCSLRVPVLSIFGASPWRRYAPFGVQNRLVRRETPCSPCAQFSMETVNGCVTYECLLSISPSDVLSALGAAEALPTWKLRSGTDVWCGTSHLDAGETTNE